MLTKDEARRIAINIASSITEAPVQNFGPLRVGGAVVPAAALSEEA
jgi:hypothetical protein